MKNLFLLLLTCPMLAYGQIEINEVDEPQKIGEIKLGGVFLIELQYHKNNGMYVFLFRDLDYQSIIELKKFEMRESDINVFYDTLVNNLKSKQEKELEVKLDNDGLLRLNFKSKKVQFLLWTGVKYAPSQYFSLKQINRLFGKG